MIRDDILRDMRNGMTMAELKKKYRSQSQFYEAFRIFSGEMEKTVNEERRNLQDVRGKLSEAKAEFGRVDAARVKVSGDVARQQLEKDRLTAEIGTAEKKQDQLRSEVKGFEAKGFSPGVLRELRTVEARSGRELVSRVQTVEKHDHLLKEVSSMKKRKASLERDVRTLETDKKNLAELIVSQRNTLDEGKLQTTTYKKAVCVAESLLGEGYSPEDIKSLAQGLRVLGIKGDPVVSVARLVGGLTKQKSIIAVDEKLRKKKMMLDKVSRDLDAALSELAAVGQGTLKTIQDGQKASAQAIADAGASSAQSIANAGVSSAQAIENATQMGKEAMKRTIDEFKERANEVLGKFDDKTLETTGKYAADLKQVVDLERRRAEAEAVIGPAMALVGLLKSREELKNVPESYILQFLERILIWLEMNAPTVSINPPERILAKDRYLRAYSKYNIVVLIELVCECLRQRISGQREK